jgi:hypothetical protein
MDRGHAKVKWREVGIDSGPDRVGKVLVEIAKKQV